MDKRSGHTLHQKRYTDDKQSHEKMLSNITYQENATQNQGNITNIYQNS